MINAILACDESFGIGKDNGLPWPKNDADLQWFKQQTTGGIIVMGRSTWDSLGRRLPNRVNVVITRSPQLEVKPDLTISSPQNPQEVIDLLEAMDSHRTIWIIGGKQIYEWFRPYLNKIYLTRVSGIYECDTYMGKEFFEGFDETPLKVDGLSVSEWTRR